MSVNFQKITKKTANIFEHCMFTTADSTWFTFVVKNEYFGKRNQAAP